MENKLKDRYYVYRIKEGNKKFTFVTGFYTLEEAKEEARNYSPSYVQGCDYTGKNTTEKIWINK